MSKENKQKLPTKIAKWTLNIFLILLLVPIAVISFKSADFFRGNEKVPEVLRDYATSDFLGFQPYIVVSNSMQGSKSDNFDAGDLALCSIVDAKDIKVGDVVSYTIGDPLDRFIVIHRVMAINEDGTFVFKGDANNTQDLNPVSANQIQARYFGKVPKVGYVVQFIGEHRVQIILGFVVIICAFSIIETIRDDDDDDDDENGETIDVEANVDEEPTELDEAGDSVLFEDDDAIFSDIDEPVELDELDTTQETTQETTKERTYDLDPSGLFVLGEDVEDIPEDAQKIIDNDKENKQ